jgi:hypothetical protein
MEESPPGPDAVRAYLDAAVAEAAERWVGRAADATAYADLVAAVLARREALSPMAHLPLHHTDPPTPVRPGPRHFERRGRPRWPLLGDQLPATAAPEPRIEPGGQPTLQPALQPGSRPALQPSVQPLLQPRVELRGAAQLPSRPPGRHRAPADLQPPQSIDLSENLHTVLDWLGRPES